MQCTECAALSCTHGPSFLKRFLGLPDQVRVVVAGVLTFPLGVSGSSQQLLESALEWFVCPPWTVTARSLTPVLFTQSIGLGLGRHQPALVLQQRGTPTPHPESVPNQSFIHPIIFLHSSNDSRWKVFMGDCFPLENDRRRKLETIRAQTLGITARLVFHVSLHSPWHRFGPCSVRTWPNFEVRIPFSDFNGL